MQSVDGSDKSSGENDKYDPWPDFKYTGRLRPYPQTARRKVPAHIPKPDYATHPEGKPISEKIYRKGGTIKILCDEEIEAMRVAGKLGREVLDEVARVIDVGVTTDEIDRVVHEACIERNCYPSILNFHNFPRSCCTSVNEVICHGIPDLRPLADGDICNVDVAVYHRGFHGDLNETFLIGNVSSIGRKLTCVTWECLNKAIKVVKPGVRYREIGRVIEEHATSNNFSVLQRFNGHGIHKVLQTLPDIPHYAACNILGVMQGGECFTIEPALTQGRCDDKLWPDKWTFVSADGLLTAQFEQTLLVTGRGAEILTARQGHGKQPYFMDKP